MRQWFLCLHLTAAAVLVTISAVAGQIPWYHKHQKELNGFIKYGLPAYERKFQSLLKKKFKIVNIIFPREEGENAASYEAYVKRAGGKGLSIQFYRYQDNVIETHCRGKASLLIVSDPNKLEGVFETNTVPHKCLLARKYGHFVLDLQICKPFCQYNSHRYFEFSGFF